MGVVVNFKTQIMVDRLIAHAQEVLANDGGLAPVAFVGKNDGSVGMIMPQDMNTQDEKEAFADVIREVSKKEQADWVLLILESWARTAKSEKEHEAFRKSGKRVSEMPDRQEVVFISLETKEGHFSGHSPLETKDGVKTFAPPEMEKVDRVEGIFTNLLAA